MAEEKPKEPVAAAAPDPEEDDLDDLDDVLDEFSAAKLEDKKEPDTSGPGRPADAPISASAAAAQVQDALKAAGPEDDFAKQLQAGMADLLGELENNPEMQKEFEKMVQELGGAAAQAADQAGPIEQAAAAEAAAAGIKGRTVSDAAKDGGAGKPPKADDFQDAIRRTMARMQESGESATAASQSAANENDILAQMMKEMEKGGFGSGLPGEEDFSKMLMGMMEQLTNKEILYEPMKELDDKFPPWMEKNKDKYPEEDMKRFAEQQRLVHEIIVAFEKEGYSDENAQDREYIVERMQAMQSAGSPPADLVGDMSAAQEALGELDAGCPTQ